MRSPGIVVLTAITAAALVTLAPATARANDVQWEYERLQALDFVGVSAVGMPWRGTWKVRPRGADGGSNVSRLEGVDAGTFLGAGWGIQLATDAPYGLRLSFGALYHRGQIVDHALPLTGITNADHGEAWFGIGWQRQFGRVSLHTQTVVALDSTTFDALAAPGGLVQGLGSVSTPAGALHVWRFDARAGQELGLHVMVGRSVLAYCGAQLDSRRAVARAPGPGDRRLRPLVPQRRGARRRQPDRLRRVRPRLVMVRRL